MSIMDNRKVSNCRNIFEQNLRNFQLCTTCDSISSKSHILLVKWMKRTRNRVESLIYKMQVTAKRSVGICDFGDILKLTTLVQDEYE